MTFYLLCNVFRPLRRVVEPKWNWLAQHFPLLDPEVSYSFTAIWLGLWIFFGHAVSSVAPSVRGLRLLNLSAHWLPWSVDWTWAALLVIPAALQLWHRHRNEVRARVKFCMLQAMTFSFIALLLFLDYPATTGVVMYSMPAVVQMVLLRQLIRQSYE